MASAWGKGSAGAEKLEAQIQTIPPLLFTVASKRRGYQNLKSKNSDLKLLSLEAKNRSPFTCRTAGSKTWS